jgi:UDPglucose 6-dehydrogenase
MKVAVFGAGYVGLVTGTCFSELGNDVLLVDIDKEKIENLNKGIIPIYEPGLDEMILRNAKENRLKFTTNAKEAIEFADVIFIAVGTPDNNGRAELKYVFKVAEDIGKYMNTYKVIVDKSTVPVGSGEKVREVIIKNQQKKIDFDVVSNPEFLREGTAIRDFMAPDRVVVGAESERAKEVMLKLYKSIERTDRPVLITDLKSSELIKYASNAMLAARISFMNELAPLCEKTGANIKQVAKGMGLDTRIGPRFLQAGVGYGGSCFPKDVKALIATGEDMGFNFEILKAVESVNERQKKSLIPKIQKMLGDVKGKKIAIFGLAFKPRTDDMREAPSIVIINELQKLGAEITAYDPVAEETSKAVINDVAYFKTPYETAKGCSAVVIVTEWDIFRDLDLEKLKAEMKQPNMIDGRNVYEPEEARKNGFTYTSIGRP